MRVRPFKMFLFITVFTLTVRSCRMSNSSTSTSDSWFAKFDLFSGSVDFATEPKTTIAKDAIILKAADKTGATFSVGALAASTCRGQGNAAANLPDIIWYIPIDSAFGISEVGFRMKNPPTDRLVNVFVDDREFVIRTPTNLSDSIVGKACEAWQNGDKEAFLDTPDYFELSDSLLTLLAPDCSFRPIDDGRWYCHIDAVDGELADREIRELQSTIIRRWSRLPYILTRRLAIAHYLAQVYASGGNAKIENFCRILSNSIPEEMPLVFSATRWQQSVCGQNLLDTQRREAATVGLSKALGEIELLRQLFEQSSNLGMLTLRLPKDMMTPTKEFWLSLTPKEDVTENLAKLSAKIYSESTSATKDPVTTGCWHPIFGSEPPKLVLAKQLDLVGTAPSSACTDVTVSKVEPNFNPHRYLAESITSETEFVLNNFSSILLRLPIGSYAISVRHHLPQAEDWESDPPVLGSSQAEWSRLRPKVVVSELIPSGNAPEPTTTR